MRIGRPRNPRRRKRTVLIQCEGAATEPNYIYPLSQLPEVRERYTVRVKPGSGKNATETLAEAIRERDRQRRRDEAFDEVWCVLDVEDPSRAANLSEAINLALQENILLFLSNPSFEVWLISHFVRTPRHFSNPGSVEAHLNASHWRPAFGQDYDKADTRVFERLAGRLDDAITNSATVLQNDHDGGPCWQCNSSTEMYLLAHMLCSAP